MPGKDSSSSQSGNLVDLGAKVRLRVQVLVFRAWNFEGLCYVSIFPVRCGSIKLRRGNLDSVVPALFKNCSSRVSEDHCGQLQDVFYTYMPPTYRQVYVAIANCHVNQKS